MNNQANIISLFIFVKKKKHIATLSDDGIFSCRAQ